MENALSYVKKFLQGEGTYLGAGNFGACWAVTIDGKTMVVKLFLRDTIHSRLGMGPRRTRQQVEAAAREEGAVLAAKTPETTALPTGCYIAHANHHYVVREYGEPLFPDDIDHLSPEDVFYFCLGFIECIRTGFVPWDSILLMRRPGQTGPGSLFIGDVGFWKPGNDHQFINQYVHLLDMLFDDTAWKEIHPGEAFLLPVRLENALWVESISKKPNTNSKKIQKIQDRINRIDNIFKGIM